MSRIESRENPIHGQLQQQSVESAEPAIADERAGGSSAAHALEARENSIHAASAARAAAFEPTIADERAAREVPEEDSIRRDASTLERQPSAACHFALAVVVSIVTMSVTCRSIMNQTPPRFKKQGCHLKRQLLKVLEVGSSKRLYTPAAAAV